MVETAANILLGAGAFIELFLYFSMMSYTKENDFVSSYFVEIGVAGFALLALGGLTHLALWLMEHVHFTIC